MDNGAAKDSANRISELIEEAHAYARLPDNRNGLAAIIHAHIVLTSITQQAGSLPVLIRNAISHCLLQCELWSYNCPKCLDRLSKLDFNEYLIATRDKTQQSPEKAKQRWIDLVEIGSWLRKNAMVTDFELLYWYVTHWAIEKERFVESSDYALHAFVTTYNNLSEAIQLINTAVYKNKLDVKQFMDDSPFPVCHKKEHCL